MVDCDQCDDLGSIAQRSFSCDSDRRRRPCRLIALQRRSCTLLCCCTFAIWSEPENRKKTKPMPYRNAVYRMFRISSQTMGHIRAPRVIIRGLLHYI